MKYAVLVPTLLGGESASGSSAVISAMSTAFQSIAGDYTTTITTVLPIILGVVGLVMLVRFGVRFFKNNVKPQ